MEKVIAHAGLLVACLKLMLRRSAILLCAGLTTILISGCCSVVAKAGDAKILTCWQLMHSKGIKMFDMKFETINLSLTGTNTLKVRNLPGFMKGQIDCFLSVQVPYSDISSNSLASWKSANIDVIFRRLDGSEFYKERLRFDAESRNFSEDSLGRRRVWGLDLSDDREGLNLDWAVPGYKNRIITSDAAFDIVIVFDHAFLIKRNVRVSLWGYARRPELN